MMKFSMVVSYSELYRSFLVCMNQVERYKINRRRDEKKNEIGSVT